MNRSESFRSAIGPIFARYLALKRALGRRYSVEGAVLRSLDAFLATALPTPSDLTPETFALWCQTLLHLTSAVRRNRMRIVRNLCLYRRRTEPGCFVPDPTLFPARHQPAPPYIFTRTEIARLVGASGRLERTSSSPLRPEVFRLAIVLLYTTGLRRGELLRLTLGDYDHQERLLLIRQTKFHKSRCLPLSSDGFREIENYLQARRARRVSMSPQTPFLWNNYKGGGGYTAGGFRQGVSALLEATDIRKPDGRLPRIHDFRHAFAVHALLRWYRSGEDVQAKLPLLATYMGHVSIVSTHYYLQFVEPLATSVSSRFAHHCRGLLAAASQQKGPV